MRETFIPNSLPAFTGSSTCPFSNSNNPLFQGIFAVSGVILPLMANQSFIITLKKGKYIVKLCSKGIFGQTQ
jgi:hypothetical protein